MSKFVIRSQVILALAVLFSSASSFAYGWAAIVFDPAHPQHFGAYRGTATRDEAEGNALNLLLAPNRAANSSDIYDLENGMSPYKETYVLSGWIALAASADGAHWATSGNHSSQYAAEQTALAGCQRTGEACYIVRSLSDEISGTDNN